MNAGFFFKKKIFFLALFFSYIGQTRLDGMDAEPRQVITFVKRFIAKFEIYLYHHFRILYCLAQFSSLGEIFYRQVESYCYLLLLFCKIYFSFIRFE